VIADLLGQGAVPDAAATLGWDRLTFIRKLTGRDKLTDEERMRAETAGVRCPALGGKVVHGRG
jgi:hypothetical protein